MAITDRIQHAWNAFIGRDTFTSNMGYSMSRPTHKTISFVNKGGIVSTIYNRIALDVAMTSFMHVRVDKKTEDETIIESGLHNCLTVEANIDQSHIQFIHDIVYSMFDEGVVAVVPVDTDLDPESAGSVNILSMRVGKITQWYPQHVEVDLYNERIGQNERITIAKSAIAIIENPLYSVVNGENSTLKRLIKKLGQMDNIDELVESGRLDLILSVPYSIKTDAKKELALKRIKDIEYQLANGKNGIAYIDGTETITQMNRPANSQIKESVEFLTQELYNQLGLTRKIFDGTADETEQRTYYSRSIDPILDSIAAEFSRKFLTKTARTQGHKIKHYRDLFKMVSVEVIVQLTDTFRRNYVASANEIRRIVGLKRSDDPRADELFNPNIADSNQDQLSKGSSIKAPSKEPEKEPEPEDEE